MVANNSGVSPAGHRIVVLPDEVELTTASGIVLSSPTEQKREEMAQIEGTLVAIGTTAWADQAAPWAELGQRVLFAKYAGLVKVGKDGKKYRILSDLDVVGVIE